MKLSLKPFTLTGAILWGGSVSLCAILNAIWPPYAQEFLQVVSSIYPGYKVTQTIGSIAVATLYAALDGGIAAFIFAWIYNKISK